MLKLKGQQLEVTSIYSTLIEVRCRQVEVDACEKCSRTTKTGQEGAIEDDLSGSVIAGQLVRAQVAIQRSKCVQSSLLISRLQSSRLVTRGTHTSFEQLDVVGQGSEGTCCHD